MKEKIEAVKTWLMENKIVAYIGAAVILFMLYKKFGRKTYRRRRRTFPRSVGMRRRRSTNTIIKSGVNRGKKAWQIKGSEAARRHMAQIRRKRR